MSEELSRLLIDLTMGIIYLDKFLTNWPDTHTDYAQDSAINWDWEPTVKADVNKRVVKFYVLHQLNIDILNEMISNYNWNH